MTLQTFLRQNIQLFFCHVRSQRRMLNVAFVWITGLCQMLFWTPIKQYHYYILTTAGEGTWMLGTDRGRTWLAKWHRTTPSVRAAPRSLGNDTFNRDSIFCRKMNMNTKIRAGFLQLFHSAEQFIRGRVLALQLCPSSWHFQTAFWITSRKAPRTAAAQSWPQSGSNCVQWWTVFIVQHRGLIQPLFKNNGNQGLGTVVLILCILREQFCQGKWK